MEKFQGRIVENILYGPPVPDGIEQDLLKAFHRALLEAGDTVLLTHGGTGETKTARQIIREATNLAANLRDVVGIGPGDVVAVCSENTIQVDVIFIAVWMLGAIYGTVSPMSTEREFEHIFGIMKPKVILCGETPDLELIRKIQQKITSIENIITVGDSGDWSLGRLLEDVSCEMEWRIPVDLGSVAALFCSSGTTGLPKCVELTHIGIQRTIATMYYLFDSYDATICSGVLPQYHGYGLVVCMDGILRKVNLIIFPRFEIRQFLASIEKYKIQSLFLVPPILVMLAKHPQVEKTDLTSVIHVRSGAAPVKPSLVTEVLCRMSKRAGFYEGYGLTETSILSVIGPVTVTAPPGAIGIVVVGTQCKVADVKSGETLGPMEEGELCFKGDIIMRGYKDNPEATAASFDSEGWLHSGDIGFFDEHGWIYVRERIKELIKYNAFQVSPSELEALILTHDSVKDVAVWGKPDETAGELPMAFVVPEPSVKISAEEITKFVADRVSPHKKLRGGVVFVKEIPKSASGKIIRRLLRTLLPEPSTLSPP